MFSVDSLKNFNSLSLSFFLFDPLLPSWTTKNSSSRRNSIELEGEEGIEGVEKETISWKQARRERHLVASPDISI